MPQAVLDEELAEGLSAAKKMPRNFALIVKGEKPVKLLVRKKKFRDAELMKAKTEAKGNDYIVGVLEASGSDFAFKVAGEKEPGANLLKLKELISEQADMTSKPRWELVKELPNVGDEEEQKEDARDDLKKQLSDTLKSLAPAMQQAIINQPSQRDAILAAAAAVKMPLGAGKLDDAQTALGALQQLLDTIASGPAESLAGKGKLSLVKLGKARLEWIGVRDAALVDIRRLRKALEAEFGADPEQAQQLKSALATLDDKIGKLQVKLHEELDNVLNSDEQGRPGLIGDARKTVIELTSFLDTDPIMTEIDDNEVVPGMRVIKPVRDKLTEISTALG